MSTSMSTVRCSRCGMGSPIAMASYCHACGQALRCDDSRAIFPRSAHLYLVGARPASPSGGRAAWLGTGLRRVLLNLALAVILTCLAVYDVACTARRLAPGHRTSALDDSTTLAAVLAVVALLVVALARGAIERAWREWLG